MLKKNIFTVEHIRKLQMDTRCDPSLLERVVYAFGLLEALSLTGLDFVFKGGTCLILLLPEPKRLSTDIDILVKSNTYINDYIQKAAEIFPFVSYEEQVRKRKNNIVKSHFKFIYESPLKNDIFHILLDVVYEEGHYLETKTHEIDNTFLEVKDPAVFVKVPTINGIMGDKLTAFAPNSIGIPFGIDKELEIIKQFYDIATLFEMINNLGEVKTTYERIARSVIKYRNLNDYDTSKTLWDSFNSAITIVGRGKINKSEHIMLSDGIKRVREHIINGKYSLVVAEKQACRVAYLVASIITEKSELMKITDAQQYLDKFITHPIYSKLNHIKKVSLIDFAYLYEAIMILFPS